MSISLIITTYNRESALALVLDSLLQQTVFPNEVIIADDGSTDATCQLIVNYQQKLPIPIHHCWQEDQGFRVAAIRNKAIAMAQYDYIILIDGDIVMHRSFIHDHKQTARKQSLIQGSRVLLGEKMTTVALSSRQITFSLFSADIRNKLNMLHFPWLSKIIRGYQHPLKGIRSCNTSFWRQDAIAVNGFNEAFISWGREDSEFVARLQHSGVKRINLKFGAIAYHLYHPISICHSPNNDALLDITLREKRVWCDIGIQQYL